MELKDRMELEEMYALHKEYYPFLEANHVNVGLLAKRLGYKRMQQQKNHSIKYFYIKKELLNHK